MKNLVFLLIFLSSFSAFGDYYDKRGGTTYHCTEVDDRQSDRKYECVSRCKYRNSSGDCISYGADFCGYNPTCDAYCKYRNSLGECISYGPDVCSSD